MSRADRTALVFALIAQLVGCAAPPPPARPPAPKAPLPVAVTAPLPPPPAPPSEPPSLPPEPSPRALALEAEATSMSLVRGRSVIDVLVPGGSFVSIGVFGERHALLGFDVVDVVRDGDEATMEAMAALLRARRPLDEDGLLPRIVSFRSPDEPARVRVLVDAAEPVELRRVATPSVEAELLPKKGKPPKVLESPVIGFPAPASRDDGYFLQAAARYQFARADVVAALLAAFRKTRVRYRRDPIAIADISQWDGVRPATDLGLPRHISHEGGRDVDIALAASDEEPSTVRAHCTGVLVEASVQGCGPGTVRGFDASRMAYFLGVLFETMPPVEKIFVDDVYLRELRRAAEVLHRRRLLKDPGFEGLFDDAIVRASPWHTDHLHVRFAGPSGKAVF